MQPLSGTGYVILGMLALGVRTGYDIKATVDRSTRFFWAASYGQIYPELRRLEDDRPGRGEELSHRRDGSGTEYTLTDAGQAELVRWLEAPAQMPELRDESLLKLFFADALPVGAGARPAPAAPARPRAGPRRCCGRSMRGLARTRPSSTSSSSTASRTPSSTSPGARSRRRGFATRRRRPPRERCARQWCADVRERDLPEPSFRSILLAGRSALRAGGVRARGRVLRGLEAREPRRRDRAWRAPSGLPSICSSAGVVGPAPSRSSRSRSCSCRP